MKFKNTTTKSIFESFLKEQDWNITKTDSNKWLIESFCGNTWEILFNSVNHFTIINESKHFICELYLFGDTIEIGHKSGTQHYKKSN